jgi:hypothetical protein
MTTVNIDIPDDLAALLEARAAAQGLSLKSWIEKLTQSAASRADSDRLVHESTVREHSEQPNIVEMMRQIRAHSKPDPEGWTVRDYINYGRRH